MDRRRKGETRAADATRCKMREVVNEPPYDGEPMKRMMRTMLTGAAAAALLIAPACTKGSTIGGTEGSPAAVETAGVPHFEGHGAEGEQEHDNVAHPAEQVAAPVHGDVNTQLEPGATGPGSLPPDGGNVEVEKPEGHH